MENFINRILSLIEEKNRELEEAKEIVDKYSQKAHDLLDEVNSLKNAVEIIKKDMKPNPIEPPVVKRIIIASPDVSERPEVHAPKYSEPFSSVIKRYKAENNLTNEKLGALINLTKQTIYNWTSGNGIPLRQDLNEIYENLNEFAPLNREEFFAAYEYSKNSN